MKTAFSFLYNGERKYFEQEGVYVIDSALKITAERKEFPEYSAAYWVLWFENIGAENTGIISDILDCDGLLPLVIPPDPHPGYMPTKGNACVISMKGCVDGEYYSDSDEVSATEFAPSHDYLYGNKRRLYRNLEGRSSSGTMPFFHVTAGGAGAMVAVGWTGSWKAEFALAEGGVSVKTGLGGKTAFYLQPGEKIRTSSVLVMEYQAGEDCGNKFRRLVKNHFSHVASAGAGRKGIFAHELWGSLPSEEMVKRIRELHEHGIQVEDIWIDAAWYGDCDVCAGNYGGEWAKYTGEWKTNKNLHPNDLLDVKEAAERAGMKIMLWHEPERATRYISMTKEHPDWYLSDDKPEHDLHYITNYGNPKAFDYFLNLLTEQIKRYGMGCYRQDYNSHMLAEYAAAADQEGRNGLTEIKHIMGLYRLWDTLSQRFPGLVIDNCASGGRRIDIEALSRTVVFFRSDYQCEFNASAEVLQTHNANLSQILPLMGCTTKIKGDTYNIRSAYASSFGVAWYNTAFQTMDEADFAWAKKVTDEYLYLRGYFSCDFYNHGSNLFDKTSWAIWQFHDPENGKGIVMAFRRESSPFATAEIQLCGIPSERAISVKNLDSGEYFESGMSFAITLPEQRSSVIFEYQIK